MSRFAPLSRPSPTTPVVCCKAPDPVRRPLVTLLKEPLTALRMFGTRCRSCNTFQVTPADLAQNQRRAAEVLRRVRVSASVYRDLFRESRA